MNVSEPKKESIRSFMHEKRMSDEQTRASLRKIERLAKFACRTTTADSVEINFLEKGLCWWSDRIRELEVFYDSVAEVEMLNLSVIKVSYVADREPYVYEVACGVCRKMKDRGVPCWWCGN